MIICSLPAVHCVGNKVRCCSAHAAHSLPSALVCSNTAMRKVIVDERDLILAR